MAPTKSTRALSSKQAVTATTTHHTTLLPLARKGLTRRAAQNMQDQNVDNIQTRGKRKAESSPQKNEKVKRSALGNLTNNVKMMTMTTTGVGIGTTGTLHLEEDAKQQLHKKKDNHHILGAAIVLKNLQNVGSGPTARQQNHIQQQHKITTRATARNAQNAQVLDVQKNKTIETAAPATALGGVTTVDQPKKDESVVPAAPLPATTAANAVAKVAHKPVRRISNEFNKTEESLYMSALEDISSCESLRFSGTFEAAKRRSVMALQEKVKTEDGKFEAVASDLASVTSPTAAVGVADADAHKPFIPVGVDDFDKANWNDPFQVSHYAMNIFEYLKSREREFRIVDYMDKQVYLSKWMRSLLVDWMVEVQETFELNHETLYLAVKIVDLYLSRVVINKDKLQLLGAAALFVACKFDERTPPLVEDFLYICDGAYKHDELIKMEMATLRTIDYDLGIPLSYRFLRRYARCAKVPMPTLTLARYILELSLMDYATVCLSDSQLACSALFMALRLHGHGRAWTPTLEYYSGYKLADFAELVPVLNAGLHRKPKGTIKTIRNKYSHKIFHEVAHVTLLSTEQLFENNLDVSIQRAAMGDSQKIATPDS